MTATVHQLPLRRPVEGPSTRPILTEYMDRKSRVLRRTRSGTAEKAFMWALYHMQTDEYGAKMCQLYDTETGSLIGILLWKVGGELVVLYKRSLKS